MTELEPGWDALGSSKAFSFSLFEKLILEEIDIATETWSLQKRPRSFGTDMVIFRTWQLFQWVG